jgi:multiple sugar transport system permease protein
VAEGQINMAITIPSRKRIKTQQTSRVSTNYTALIIVIIGGILMVLPLYMMFVFASQPKDNIFRFPPPMWFGDSLIHNYQALIQTTEGRFWRIFWNSTYLSVVTTATQLFFCALAGYGFAMYEFKHKDKLFSVLLATMAIPGALNLVPLYLVLSLLTQLFTPLDNAIHSIFPWFPSLLWIGSPKALWFPGMASAFGIFQMRQYIMSAIPKELVEAARIDGSTEFQTFWKIILPLSRPALGTLGLVTFIGIWNEYVLSIIIFKTPESQTLQTLLRLIGGGGTNTNVDFGAVMMGVALTVVPLLILFILTSRQMIAGLTSGGVKT